MDRLLVVTLVVVALCFLESVDSSAYDKILSHSRIRARNEGPNMCAVQQVEGTKKKYFSTCRNWYKKSICGKRAEILYECCPGYMALEDKKGCPAVAPIDDVYGTLELLKATTTQKYADMSNLKEEIKGKGSFTLFAPSNDAWDELDTSVKSALENNPNTDLYDSLHYHMVNQRLMTKDMKNDMTFTSMHNDLEIYINHYSNGVVTVNCARIIHGNQVAKNGVVHIIDRVISSVSGTIKDYLENDEDLSTFTDAAFASEVMDKLGEPGHYTLFVPTNDAFDKLSPGYMESITENQAVIKALVNNHLLNSIQCAEAIMAGTVYETAEGSTIEIGCDGDSLTVNGIKMVLKKDIVTSNGVIHLIDQVLVPNSAKEVKELMGDSQREFSKFIRETDLSSALGLKTEYTLLAPLNTVFTDKVISDKSLLRLILENHLLKLKITLSELFNGQLLETLSGKTLRVFIYRTAVCIENACMVRGSKEGRNGALHLMKSLIRPAEKTIYELLTADGRFKIFLELMEAAGLEDLLKQEGSYTVFAPTDDAFEGLNEEDLALLKSDQNVLRNILLYHFSDGVFINGGLEQRVTNLLKSMQGSNLQVKSVNNSIFVNSMDVADSDMMATNGVIHAVENVLYPAELPVGSQDIMSLLQKIIKHIQFKFISGYSYIEIPLTFIKTTITTTHYVEGQEPKTKTVTRVIERQPTMEVTRVIEGQQAKTTVTRVVEGQPPKTKVTRVIEGQPAKTKVTRVIEGQPPKTKVTRVIEGQPPKTKVTRVIEAEPMASKVVVEGESSMTEITKTVETKPSTTKVTRVIGRQPIKKVTRVISGTGMDLGADKRRTETGGQILVKEPQIIAGPDFSKFTDFLGNPSLVNEESDRITKIIQAGKGFAPARKGPVGVRRRARLVRRHQKPRE
ncbi:periostin [Kryptolebias marmoratus]|uniref:Periostin, osteoblast specific factor a n=1 Tax=Kryptolebias marmoratus TaxID=37003 RepID=A0A3Q2ZUB2_KRYMA|nr:periostin [Kryptolebias marmoratus]